MASSLPGLCLDGKLKNVRAALARKEEVNQRDAGGYTGLMEAAERGHEAVVVWGWTSTSPMKKISKQPCMGPVKRDTLGLSGGCWLIPL